MTLGFHKFRGESLESLQKCPLFKDSVRVLVRTDKHNIEIAISDLVPLLFCEENEMRQPSFDNLLDRLHKIAHLVQRLKTVETELMMV